MLDRVASPGGEATVCMVCIQALVTDLSGCRVGVLSLCSMHDTTEPGVVLGEADTPLGVGSALKHKGVPSAGLGSVADDTPRQPKSHGFPLDLTTPEPTKGLGPKVASCGGGEAAFLVGQEWENEVARNVLSLYYAGKGSLFKSKVQKTKLPAIAPSKEPKTKQASRGGQCVTGKRQRPRHIWFSGTGVVRTVWCRLEGVDVQSAQFPDTTEPNGIGAEGSFFLESDASLCAHVFCRRLRKLEVEGKYQEYVSTAQAVLRAYSRKKVSELYEDTLASPHSQGTAGAGLGYERDAPEEAPAKNECENGPSENDCRGSEGLDADFISYELLDPRLLTQVHIGESDNMLWRQLVVCCFTFGQKYVDAGKHGQALVLLKLAEEIVETPSTLEGGSAFQGKVRRQMLAFIWANTAYYYFKRKKLNAAAAFAQKAMRAHKKLEQWGYVARCYLHCGAISAALSKHKASLECLVEILAMVEDGRLEVGGTKAQKICMVAVCYHNLAVTQVCLRRPAEACIASQNARKLARLSLSYANRWINTFEATHRHCLAEVTQRHLYMDKSAPRKVALEQGSGDRESKEVQRVYENIAASLLHA